MYKILTHDPNIETQATILVLAITISKYITTTS